MKSLRVLVVFCLVQWTSAAVLPRDDDEDVYEAEVSGVLHMLQTRAANNATFRAEWEAHLSMYDSAPQLSSVPPYDCTLPKSPSVPTTAHSVRPSDINVIGALGDSVTAGFGITATSLPQVLRNDRHLAWISGGQKSLDEGVVSITNILRKFNPGITGYSYAESWSRSKAAGLNLAVGASIASDLDGQAKRLIGKMKKPEYGVDWENDWKLINLMIGGNDLCRICWNENKYSPERYAANIQSALDILYAEVPRTIVMVSAIFDITPLPAFSDGLICDVVQTVVCNCATSRDQLKEAQKAYVKRLFEIINSGRYDRGRQDFTVVGMPHFNDALPPNIPGTNEPDRSFWAPDCFHPGRKAHYAVATSLWNQMFEPVGQKRSSLDWQVGTNLHCPTEDDPFIKTNVNSKL